MTAKEVELKAYLALEGVVAVVAGGAVKELTDRKFRIYGLRPYRLCGWVRFLHVDKIPSTIDGDRIDAIRQALGQTEHFVNSQLVLHFESMRRRDSEGSEGQHVTSIQAKYLLVVSREQGNVIPIESQYTIFPCSLLATRKYSESLSMELLPAASGLKGQTCMRSHISRGDSSSL